ncbi:RraA family protein [Ureibacillus chungkukjangi]|uniref:Putative 4-hydroxy-4-methyl-2-oxoglutarate aldolase n=1 Tax=Ureibacillus chungkukjangi TaxID=1202712 RepID=A0A318U116_9BACL|nr:RraA family protein [Ureibacillus chungkukjangi]MCM3389895.1 RraA family protein [Ureibacillus chungkukjangi]PYF08938.1 regulator of RNase E activity RraA [Ureibacillus chungkukjangi]
MNNIGFRIIQNENTLNEELIERFRPLATSLLSDSMNRLHAIGHNLRPYHKEGKLIGCAFTVKTRVGDNLMVHKAIDIAKPGDVIVVEASGDLTNAIIGEIMVSIARKNGIAGFVIDGAIRDSGTVSKGTFPVYARGVTHLGPYKDGPGEINVPVSIDGMVINPGDIIVGDEDGLVAIPSQNAEQIIKLAQQQQEQEKIVLQSIEDGSIDRRWIDETLRQKGCDGL